jgi:hypothetical protein
MEIDTLVRAAVREGQPDVTWWASTELQPRESSIVAMAAQELVKLRAKLSGRYAAVVRGEHE